MIDLEETVSESSTEDKNISSNETAIEMENDTDNSESSNRTKR